MANMIKHANLEIEKSKSIANERLEGFRVIKQSSGLIQTKLELFEREFNSILGNVSDIKLSGEFKRLAGGLGEIRTILTTDVRNIQIEEPLRIIGDIHGTDAQFLRLQSAFREIERENQILRGRYVKWQGDLPNVHLK
jgi:hypothetical protein